MVTATLAALGLAAGLHGALYGPYAITWLLYVALCSHSDW